MYIAYTYLYVYRDAPSKGCFSFAWCLPGCACMGQTGQVASGVLACGHVRRQGCCSPSCSPQGRPHCYPLISGTACCGCLTELTCHGWKSQCCTWRWMHHTFAHSMSKDIPSPSKCQPKSLDCYCFPAPDSLPQGFIFLSSPNEFLSPVEILCLFFSLKFSSSCNLKILLCEFTGKFNLCILE